MILNDPDAGGNLHCGLARTLALAVLLPCAERRAQAWTGADGASEGALLVGERGT